MAFIHNLWNDPIIRRRSKEPISIGSTYFDSLTGSQGPLATQGWQESQRIITEHNPVSLLGQVRQDIGGPFQSMKVNFVEGIYPYELTQLRTDGAVRRRAIGPLVASDEMRKVLGTNFNPDGGMSDSAVVTSIGSYAPGLLPDSTLDSFGATAISRVSPTNPFFDSSVALAELLREGAPLSKRDDFNPGSLYLNYQFGVAPTANDVKSFKEARRRSGEILEQLERDSGKLVRRRYEAEPVTDVSHKQVSGTYPIFTDGRVPNINLVTNGTRTEVVKTTTKLWFSGAFTYHFPKNMGGWRGKLLELERVYGVQPGPSTAYNLLPWSWLVDYFTNLGDMIENLDLFLGDGLVMPWAYVMATQTREVTHSWTGLVLINNSWTRVTLHSRYTGVTLQRRRASPYGFGYTTDLTDRQLSILAALGMSRV